MNFLNKNKRKTAENKFDKEVLELGYLK